MLVAITFALVFGDTSSTADLFGLRRFFGGAVATSRPSSSVLRQGSSAVQGSFPKERGVEDEVRATMRTPVYFLSHGGVCFPLSFHPSNASTKLEKSSG